MNARREKGAVLVVVVGLLTVLMVLGTGYLYAARMNARTGDNQRLAAQLMFTAQAGTERALARLARDTTWRAGFAAESFEGGTYTVAVTGAAPDLRILSKAGLQGLEREVTVEAEIASGVCQPLTCVLFAEGNIEFNVPQDPAGPDPPAVMQGNVACNGSILRNAAEVRIDGDITASAGFDPVAVDVHAYKAPAQVAGTYYGGAREFWGDHSSEDVIYVDGDVIVRNWYWDSNEYRQTETKLRTLVVEGNVEIVTWGDSKPVEFKPSRPDDVQNPAIVCTGNLVQRIYTCEDPESDPPEPAGLGDYGNRDVAPLKITGIVYAEGDVTFHWIKKICDVKTCIYAGGNARICIRADAEIEFDGAHLTDVESYPSAFTGTEVGQTVHAVAWR